MEHSQTKVDSPISQACFSPWRLSFFSSLGFWIADMALYPFDTIATRIKANKHQFSSFYKEIEYILKHENFKSFYRGFSSTFPCSFVSNIVYFMCYENLNKISKSYLDTIQTDRPYLSKLKYCIPLITSPLSELVSLMVYLPFDIVRTRLQTNLPEYDYKSLNQGVIQIVKAEGLIRLYKASVLYLFNTCLYVGLQMWFYELMRAAILNNYKRETKNKMKFSESLISSFVVSVVATVIVNPVDVIFTRYQIIDSNKEKLSTMKVLKDLIRDEGFKAFGKGLGAKILGNVSLGLIWLPLYDFFKTNLPSNNMMEGLLNFRNSMEIRNSNVGFDPVDLDELHKSQK